MPGPLQHSPADVVAQLIVDLGFGFAFDSGVDWATFVSGEPDLPDDCLTVYDSEGHDHGRAMVTGERQGIAGFQLRVRSTTQKVGFTKAQEIGVALDTVYLAEVLVDGVGYLVQSVKRNGDPVFIGKDESRSKRSIHVLNGMVSLRESDAVGDDRILQESGGYILLD